MKAKIFHFLAQVLESRPYLGMSAVLDGVVVSISQLKGRVSPTPGHTILVPTVGSGNIGDQAMFESFLDNVAGKIVSIVGKSDSLHVPARHAWRVTTVAIPGLTGGVPLGRLRGRFVLCSLLRDAKSINIIGADIMDGGYSRRESILRSQLLWIANRVGVPGQVLGFSWNGKSEPLTRRYMKYAAGSAKFNLRDPRSFDRFSQLGFDNIQKVSDMAFTLDSSVVDSSLSGWVDRQKNNGRRIALLNTSGLIAVRHNLDDDYEQVANRLLARGYSVLIVPHVIRKGDNDLAPARRLAESLSNREEVHLVERQLSPGNVVWLAGNADVCITGRMHLAILSFAQCVPAITLATQGKVEGMLEMFGMEHLACQPRPGVGNTILDLLDDLIPNLQDVQNRIRHSLPGVQELSRLNYELPNTHS